MTVGNVKISGIMLAGVIIIVSFVYALNVQPVVTGDSALVEYRDLRNFESYKELTEFLCKKASNSYDFYWGYQSKLSGMIRQDIGIAPSSIMLNADSDEGGKTVDYSNTNIQVAGVDEPDIVKTDGEYLYIVSDNKVFIVKAAPAEDAEIICEIEVENTLNIQNIFINNNNRLVILAQRYNYIYYAEPIRIQSSPVIEIDGESINATTSEIEPVIIPPPWHNSPETHILIYDLRDLENPESVKDVSVPGHFTAARMIEDYVYLITVQYEYEILKLDENQTIQPRISINNEVKEIPLLDIKYVDTYTQSNTITNIISVNVHDDEEETKAKIFLLGNTDILYASKNNFYIANYKRSYDYDMLQETIEGILQPMLPDSMKLEIELIKNLQHLEEYQKQDVISWILQDFAETLTYEQQQELYRQINQLYERTTIHRIHVENGEIVYQSQGSIPGKVQNQFSLSEHNGYLRASSTMEGLYIDFINSWMEEQNNIYVLNMELETVGKLEGLAPDEDIYATRFLGDKCYLVTFKQIDPFFVIDLSDPTNPTLLGELKIPGYSTYLHPYDESHIIGIGIEDRQIKISLFDVTDMNNPVELSKYTITKQENNWRSSQSEALYEHKAFLFDREKNLLVIPAGTYSKQSAYVFDITLEDGLQLKGTITHEGVTNENENYTYYYDYGNSIKRTLYIEDVLYTLSDNMLKMNNLDDLSEINSINLK